MNKILSRLFIFFFGIPIIVGIIWLPYVNHIFLRLFILLLACLSAAELHNLLSKRFQLPNKAFIIVITAMIPLLEAIYQIALPYATAQTRTVKALHDMDPTLIATVFSFTVLLLEELIHSSKTTENSASRIIGSVFIFFYVGFLLTFVSKISSWSMTRFTTTETLHVESKILTCFLVMVFMCDSLAWFFGVLFGKRNKGFLKASPNKSIAGFIGGWLGAIITALGCTHLWPTIFGADQNHNIKAVLLGFIIAIVSQLGDLFESILKRSVDIKDSGKIVPGRGGVLDSIDSIVAAAPVFYLLFQLFYGPIS